MKRIDIHVEGLSVEARGNLANAIYAALAGAGSRAVRNLSVALVLAFVLVWAVSWVLFKTGVTRDSTDGDSPSNLRLYTDALTGCQYLGNGNGLTPRMDAQGYQVCGDKSGDKL
ncbi:hypothetical protein FKH18_25285 [Salmonella enterica]|uniref:Uncharacterized protein n=2 Tax=Salmonella enterica TaxID=28901 RepID=A0A619I418_SALER|nr:hypothetical protein [Salmonella enterica subsp. enterica serovar Java]EAM1813074.1 hypothetical protein [Salmonella enterica]EBV8393844.1 hypothetical protein [Salmonella enterica subsp. enterica serovar Virchow]ECW9805363.1 hypothetical protein [Salmonella enterica subsp. enterica serovar Poona]EDV9614984.1 hypothetical protein [Salmonella enterica subsp. enterica serovar Paratyphi B]EEM8442453.1 hypothetical protein [Salmonella enterica subsp. enterica serovar Oranienburg]EFV0933814.1 h